jgi:hypothetical protein
MSYLLWARGSTVEAAAQLRPGQVLRVGRRATCDLVLHPEFIAPFHAEIAHEGAVVRIRYLYKHHGGIRLNGERCQAGMLLAPGDELWIRHNKLWLEDPPGVDPAWLAWNGGVVSRLAQVAYHDRRLLEGLREPSRPAVLADALEDAGCGDTRLLGGLRGQRPPAWQMWVAELLAGRS